MVRTQTVNKSHPSRYGNPELMFLSRSELPELKLFEFPDGAPGSMALAPSQTAPHSWHGVLEAEEFSAARAASSPQGIGDGVLFRVSKLNIVIIRQDDGIDGVKEVKTWERGQKILMQNGMSARSVRKQEEPENIKVTRQNGIYRTVACKCIHVAYLAGLSVDVMVDNEDVK
ncbi:hypothetical protein RRG08_008539 [Elysia crispata]|uniref:Uncharacterized protein n=1 Tax=Elysia crispata TaxID=231223 RepID=A0AAE0YE50_9GAST|nr:hypothetical protein RRG08_008539 [Elysia crispata]